MSRAGRLQALARGDEGFLLSLGYSTQRGYGRTHPFAGEIRVGEVEVEFVAPELGFAVPLGRVEITECQMINQFTGSADSPPAQFTRGYGLAFGRGERKAMSMSLVDRALRTDEFAERIVAPAQDEEFVISHADNVAATGFVEHLKLPHYVDFQAELVLVRQLHDDFRRRVARVADNPADTSTVSSTRRHHERHIHRLQHRLPGRADQADDSSLAVESGCRAGGVPGAVRLARGADAAWLGHRRCPGDRGGSRRRRRVEGHRPGADDTTNAVSIRTFFAEVSGVATTTVTEDATVIQTRHRIPPETPPLRDGQILVYQVPIPEPLRFLEPRETETSRLHALEDYG